MVNSNCHLFIKEIAPEKEESMFLEKSSLDNLSQSLISDECEKDGKYYTHHIKFNEIGHGSVFPYLYNNSMEKLSENKLPEHEEFEDILRQENMSRKELNVHRISLNVKLLENIQTYF